MAIVNRLVGIGKLKLQLFFRFCELPSREDRQWSNDAGRVQRYGRVPSGCRYPHAGTRAGARVVRIPGPSHGRPVFLMGGGISTMRGGFFSSAAARATPEPAACSRWRWPTGPGAGRAGAANGARAPSPTWPVKTAGPIGKGAEMRRRSVDPHHPEDTRWSGRKPG